MLEQRLVDKFDGMPTSSDGAVCYADDGGAECSTERRKGFLRWYRYEIKVDGFDDSFANEFIR